MDSLQILSIVLLTILISIVSFIVSFLFGLFLLKERIKAYLDEKYNGVPYDSKAYIFGDYIFVKIGFLLKKFNLKIEDIKTESDFKVVLTYTPTLKDFVKR